VSDPVKSSLISIFFAVPKPEKMYETGRAFTYLLLEESVANDVINVSLFAYDKITSKTYNINKKKTRH